MHSSLAVAFTYDRYLNGRAGSHRTPEECYHWHQGTALLSDRLKRPIEPKAKDAIWGTTAALAMLTVSSPDANSPEDSWPLQSVDGSELDWLCMLNGKMSLWSVFDPLRPDSIFRVLTMTYAQMHSPLPRQGIQGISPSIAELCELDHFSTAETSPYFLAAHAVSQLLIRPDEEVTVGDIPVFTQTVHGSFESLLRARDPIALLLLYLWYRKSGRNIWWIALRAKVECPAIRLYLEWYHKDHAEVHALLALDRPAAICT